MKYKFLEHTADIMFEAYGKNLNELFENAALAIFESTANIKTVKAKIKKEIKLENKDTEELLHDFLSEIIFLKDAKALIFSKVKVSIKKNKLKATLFGDKINKEKQELKDDIKAITYHLFKLEKTKHGYKATAIIDI